MYISQFRYIYVYICIEVDIYGRNNAVLFYFLLYLKLFFLTMHHEIVYDQHTKVNIRLISQSKLVLHQDENAANSDEKYKQILHILTDKSNKLVCENIELTIFRHIFIVCSSRIRKEKSRLDQCAYSTFSIRI